jgi:carbamoyltransferase
MKILGISDGLTSGTALIENGKLVYAVHEERLIRAKMATGFPRQSISKVLEDTHTKPQEIDAIAVAMVNDFFREKAVPFDGWFVGSQPFVKEMLLSASSQITHVFGARPLLQKSYYEVKSILGSARRKAIGELLRHDWGLTCPIKFIDHHFAHACSAYFTAGMNEATVITLDGAGDNSSSHVYYAKNGHFRKFWNVDSFNSVGNYYGYITHLCGFKAHKHEGKITGLAGYGKPLYVDILKRFIAYENGNTVNKGQVFYWAAVKALEKALPSAFRREDLAASIQQLLEEIGCAYIQHWVNQTGCANLALAGGVFANVKLNQRIHELGNIKSLFIHPGMGDEGLAVGAAYALSSSLSKTSGTTVDTAQLTDVYLGPEFGETEIAQAVSQAGLEPEHTEHIERRIAALLAQGYVVARFNGRMEYGPRALGNRSILYQATDPTVNNWLNERLERTEFMPFAPVTMEKFADQAYANLDGAKDPARFMTITVNCTDWMRKHCPAVVHLDGTARPQIIDQRTNPSYYKILDEYRNLSGLPTLINTSFNMHEEPIVCSPQDAIRAFLQGRLDYLAIGSFLLKHPSISAATREPNGGSQIHRQTVQDVSLTTAGARVPES